VDSLWEYFEQKRAEFRRLSLGASNAELDDMFSTDLASGDRSGRIDGVLYLDQGAYVAVLERVHLTDDGRPHRIRYAYFLIVDGVGEIVGYERDPTHDPAEHRHLPGHARQPWPAVSFVEAVTDFWNRLATLRECGT
jgi:hypothetical protein